MSSSTEPPGIGPRDTLDTLIEILRRRAREEPERLAYTFLEEGEVEAAHLTWGGLDRRARAVAAALQERARPGDRALLLFPPGLDFIAALFGGMYAGVVPVPCTPPQPRRGLEKLKALALDAAASLVLSARSLRGRLESDLARTPALRDLPWLLTDEIPLDLAESCRPWAARPEDLALLQYTSGSTSAPRGVMVSHGNLLHNERLIQEAFAQDAGSVVVGWLPLYHDMGLIGNVLQPLFSGGRCVLMSPMAFLQRPRRWLEAISRYRADTSGGPDFAYELCARKAADAVSGLDLSCWRLAFSGAEPVRAATLDRFAEVFASAGFRREAFYPCYGLAEGTLFVSGGRPGESPRVRAWSAAALAQDRGAPPGPGEEARRLVSCGAWGQRRAVVDSAAATLLPPGRVGEIWVAGPSVAQGYWGRPEETERIFGASMAGTGEGPFLRTGDLGFLADGELYVTGRLKDLVILRGRNHYPQDLELTAERSHPLLRPGCGAAFSVEEGGGEHLIVVQEIDRRAGPADLGAALEAIWSAVSEEHELQPAAVVLVQAGSVPKTSSGKVQRHLCRARFLDGTLAEVGRRGAAAASAPAAPPSPVTPPGEDIEPWLAARLAARLGIDPAAVDPHRPVAYYGVDSLGSMELVHEMETGLGVEMSVASFLGSPSIADLAAVVRAARAHSREAAASTAPAEASEHPLSLGQQGLLFLQQLVPHGSVHNISAAARLRGSLDVRRLRSAFQELVDRHPALRSTFSTPAGRPVQRVHERMEIAFEEDDAAAWSDVELARRLADDADRPFDLERGPPLRVKLFSLAGGEAVLLLTVHHIVADFWSLGVIARELAVCYEVGSGAMLPALPAHPADHARREAELLAGAGGERLWDHWRRRLDGELPVLDLPKDRPRSPEPDRCGASRRARIDRATAAALQRLTRSRGATLYMGLLAAFQALLHRYSGQTDLVVGSPMAGRTRADFAGLVGYFVNLVPLRADLGGAPSFTDLLERTRETVLAALTGQEYPFARLVERLQPAREPGCPPLFQVVFVLHKAPPPAPEELALLAMGEPGGAFQLGSLTLEPLALERRRAEFDLALAAAETAGELATCLHYGADLFDPATAERMLGHFVRLLAAALERPAEPLAALPILDAAERHQLLTGWAGEPPAGPAEDLLHHAFEAQADRRPEAPALTFEGRDVTYGELNRRANRLANVLCELGVGPEILVGLCAERSVEMLVGILGILKAGGAYLPLDPRLPRERLELLVRDAGTPVLLAPRAAAGTVEGLGGAAARLLCLEDGEAAGRPGCPVGSGITGQNAAYVIYTSGSTGQPKGVLIPHRQVARLFAATRPWFSPGPDDVWTLFHSFAFDFSVWEIWGALLHGGRLVVVPHGVTRSPDAFHRLLHEEGVTVLSQTPSAFRQLAAVDAAQSVEDTGRLRWIVFGGEALDVQSLRPWFDHHGDRRPRLVNMYGITETTVHVTYRPLAAADLDRPASPIGTPIPDLQIYLLDAFGEPAPLGVPGEIHVGGAGLARGYLRRPELTAARFVPDPFGGEPGARLYRSGDLARRRPNGGLEFLGRTDHQVKVRGFRIEPGEIEAALRNHPGVRDAVVLARKVARPAPSLVRLAGGPEVGAGTAELRRFLKDQPSAAAAATGEALLVAYVVTGQEGGPSVQELRRSLQGKLPDYMVPGAFVRVAALPLTANGKLDVQALPHPDGSRPELEGVFVSPSGPVEATLAEVWAGVLGLDRVGAEDNFFELGGDSIRSIQVRAQAEARGLRFSLQDLLEHQTVRSLARALEAGDEPGPAVPVEGGRFSLVRQEDLRRLPGGVEDAYPLARIQAGVIFHSQSNPEDPMYHDIFLYHLRVRFDLGCWTEAVQRVCDRHAILRTSFDLSRFSEPLQLVQKRIPAGVRVVDLRALGPAEQRQAQEVWIAAEKRRCFAWDRAPLIRFFLHRLGDEETHLVLSFHDAILDGWSTALLLTELLRGYVALLEGRQPVPQPPPRVTFRDFVALERAAIASEDCRDFWQRNLSGCTAGRLPRWPRERRPGAAPVISVLEVPVSAGVSDALKATARRAGAPLKHVLLAAHVKAMSLLAGHPDVLTGLESNGRLEVAEGDQTLGIHLNSLPFRLIVPAGSWIELVRATFAAERELLPYRRYPLAELQKGRSGEPLFEAVFNYTHFHVFRQLQGIDGLEISGARGFGETHFALRVEFNRDPFSDQVQLDLECDVEDLPRSQLEAIGGLFARTLAALATAPGEPHNGCLLSPAERHQILAEWNPAAALCLPERPIHRLFEEQARQTPGTPAVALGEKLLTYGELAARANRLARWLRGQGVRPGKLVGILAQRSLDLVVAILGVLKAGGAYVPLDPEYPREHLARVAADADLALLLTQERLPEELRGLHARTAFLDADPAPWSGETDAPLDDGAGPDDLAYVIYTSGSTGASKGVQVTHRNLVSSTWSRFAVYTEPMTAYLLVPSFAFDSSVAGIFWTLCGGGTLVLLEEGGQRDPSRLVEAVVRHGVSHLLCIPSLYELLLSQRGSEACRTLAAVIVAGEACPPGLPDEHRRRFPHARLYNEYGPTEGTVWCTVQRCTDLPAGRPVPIGRPIPTARIHLLDTGFQPVLIGVPGELYLGGEGLARGYLDRPELTAERWLPDPWSGEPGQRLYRTGDLARWLPGGEIEFLGRCDDQVKVRGFRIEPGEIEQILQQHPAVREAAVVAREDGRRGRQLAAYVVPGPGVEPAAAELRRFVAARLPEHMVPRWYVLLEELPRTPTGKIDRRRLPDPRPAPPEVLASLLSELEALSPEEAEALLEVKKRAGRVPPEAPQRFDPLNLAREGGPR